MMEEQTDDICKQIIDINYRALEFVKNQTEELCEYAIH